MSGPDRDLSEEEVRKLVIENTTNATVGERDRSAAQSGTSSNPNARIGVGRHVTLRRRNGEYILLRGNSVIQSFCIGDFERITRFSIPEGVQQRVWIQVVPLSPPYEISPPGDEEAPAEDGVELRTIAHPTLERGPGLRPETLEEMEIELPNINSPSHALSQWQTDAIDCMHGQIEGIRAAMEVVASLRLPR